MTTSLDKSLISNGNQIIQDAYEHIRVKQKGQALDADDQAQAERYLNLITKDLQKDGLHLWKEKEAALFFEPSRRTYKLGNQTTFVCAADDTPAIDNQVYATEGDWVATTLSADAAGAQADIVITSLSAYSGTTFNTSCTDINVGVVLDDGTIQWAVLSSIATLTITLDANLSSAASSGNRVFLYQDHLDKPLKILKDNVRVWQSSTSEIPIQLQSWTDYNNLSNKGSTGLPVQIAYKPELDTGELAVWPISSDINDVLLFRYQAPIDIFDGTADQDFPAEWTRTLGWLLAAELGQAKGVPLQRQQYLDMKAMALKEDLLDWDADNTSLYLQPRQWG
jgi:hypothetical protein